MSGRKNFRELSAPIDSDLERRARVDQIEEEYDALLTLAVLRDLLRVARYFAAPRSD